MNLVQRHPYCLVYIIRSLENGLVLHAADEESIECGNVESTVTVLVRKRTEITFFLDNEIGLLLYLARK